jgi:hypothetical protein
MIISEIVIVDGFGKLCLLMDASGARIVLVGL